MITTILFIGTSETHVPIRINEAALKEFSRCCASDIWMCSEPTTQGEFDVPADWVFVVYPQNKQYGRWMNPTAYKCWYDSAQDKMDRTYQFEGVPKR